MERLIEMAEAAIYDQGRQLMIVCGDQEQQAAGMLSFPGGGLDFEVMPDVLERTAIREAEEEAGVSISDLEYVESHSFIGSEGIPVVYVGFLCRYAGGTPTVRDPGEVADVCWLTIDEILRDSRFPPWLDRVIRAAERKRQALGWSQVVPTDGTSVTTRPVRASGRGVS